MLKPKPRIVPLEEGIWRALMQEILIAGRKKISIVKNMVSLSLDEYICAGLYTFILEEFGKLILLAACPIINNKREIKYAGEFGEFTNHERKFGAALDYLEANGFEEAYILNNEGSFDPKSFS